jgi:hypothetical protein
MFWGEGRKQNGCTCSKTMFRMHKRLVPKRQSQNFQAAQAKVNITALTGSKSIGGKI